MGKICEQQLTTPPPPGMSRRLHSTRLSLLADDLLRYTGFSEDEMGDMSDIWGDAKGGRVRSGPVLRFSVLDFAQSMANETGEVDRLVLALAERPKRNDVRGFFFFFSSLKID